MNPTQRPLLLVAALLVAACSRKTDDRTAALKDSVATDSSLASDLRKATDTTAVREAADIAVAPDTTTPMRVPTTRPTQPAAPTQTPTSTPAPANPPTRLKPPPRTDRTPSIPVNPGVIRPTPPTTGPASGPPGGAGGLAARDANYPIDACENPSTETQRRCLMAYLSRSDVLLDRNYQALITDMKREAGTAPGQPEPDAVQRLRTAQRAWLVYRDTECRQRNRGQEGAIWAPVRAACLGEFSGRRAEELAGMLAERRAASPRKQ